MYSYYNYNSTDTWVSMDVSNCIGSKNWKMYSLLSTSFLSYLTKISEEAETAFHVVKCPLQCFNE